MRKMRYYKSLCLYWQAKRPGLLRRDTPLKERLNKELVFASIAKQSSGFSDHPVAPTKFLSITKNR
jgi:hypothetical protein